jgi:hypothetical protein
MMKILTGATGLALVAGAAAPAAAQSYPYGGSGYGNPVGQVINQVLGRGSYGQYGYGGSQVAIDQCAGAALQRVDRRGYGNYRQTGYGYNSAGRARIVAITRVEQRRNGVRVRGVIDPGYRTYAGYGGAGQLEFTCAVDYRGYVSDVDIHRRTAYRGY